MVLLSHLVLIVPQAQLGLAPIGTSSFTNFFAETTAMNPQFHIQIPRSSASATAKCHVVVSVTQQYETNPGKGLFNNDFTQVGGGGSYFCDAICEGQSKTCNLM